MGLFFFSVLKQYAYISESATLRKLGSLIIRQFKEDIEEATIRSVSTGDSGVIVQPISAIDPPAETVWSDDIICYLHQVPERKLLRWVQEGVVSTSGPGPQTFTEADIQRLRPPDSQVRQWDFVDKFEVVKTTGSSLTISISLRSTDERRHQHTYETTQSIFANDGT